MLPNKYAIIFNGVTNPVQYNIETLLNYSQKYLKILWK